MIAEEIVLKVVPVSLHYEDSRIRKCLVTGRNEVVDKVMFLQASVIPSTGGVSASVHVGIPHPPEQTPQEADTTQKQTPPRSRHPPREDTPPRSRHPLQEQTSPKEADTTPQEAGSGIWSMNGRYASYWNAFLYEDVNTGKIEFYNTLAFLRLTTV